MTFRTGILLLILVWVGAAMPSEKAAPPKIGLVLSGGGARGFAHIGILKMLDSLQIPIDYIAGTSMGGIVGGLYAIGFSGREIENLARNKDWEALFDDKPARELMPYVQKEDDGIYQLSFNLKGITPVTGIGLISGQKISLLLSRLTLSAEYVRDFDAFPIPFRCVAADLITGNQVVLREGSLAKALRATMSIPTIFSPVEWGDSLLIDGGILNNVPVDVVRSMGAEYVIAVDVGTPLYDRNELKDMQDIFTQAINIPLNPGIIENIKRSDMVITPPLKGRSSSDFGAEDIDAIIRAGESAASAHRKDLLTLKRKFGLSRLKSLPVESDTVSVIAGISISGNTRQTFKELADKLGVTSGQPFDSLQFSERLAEFRTSGIFKKVDYHFQQTKPGYVRLIIDVEERTRPMIHSISIEGNEKLSFRFLYRLLDLKPGDQLDDERVNRRIDEMYALGFFETLTYEIKPRSDNKIHFILHVQERSLRTLRIGYRYDDYYKLIGQAAVQINNLLLPGIRLNSSIAFAGLTNFKMNLAYPSRNRGYSIFPYLRFDFMDRLVNIYNEKGNKTASYHDRSLLAAAGFTLLLDNRAAIDLEYNVEKMNIDPSIAVDDPEQFPSWDDQLRQVSVAFNLDNLDNVTLPASGAFLKARYDGSMLWMGSQTEFHRVQAVFDQYVTPFARHTFRIHSDYVWGDASLPVYKYMYRGGPNSFVGMEYMQVIGRKYVTLRLDYRYRYKKDIFFKLIINGGMNYYNHDTPAPVQDFFKGYGIGMKFLSLIGPFEFIFSRGDRSFYKSAGMRNIFYFQAGFNLPAIDQ